MLNLDLYNSLFNIYSANIYDAASHITRIWLTFNYDISKSYWIGYGRFLPEYEKMWLCCPLVMAQLKSLKLQHRRTKLKTRTKIQLSKRIKKRCSALAVQIKKERKTMTNYTTSLNDPSMRSNDWGHTRTVCRQQQWPIDPKHWLWMGDKISLWYISASRGNPDSSFPRRHTPRTKQRAEIACSVGRPHTFFLFLEVAAHMKNWQTTHLLPLTQRGCRK